LHGGGAAARDSSKTAIIVGIVRIREQSTLPATGSAAEVLAPTEN